MRNKRMNDDGDSFALPTDTLEVIAEVNSRFTRPIKIF